MLYYPSVPIFMYQYNLLCSPEKEKLKYGIVGISPRLYPHLELIQILGLYSSSQYSMISFVSFINYLTLIFRCILLIFNLILDTSLSLSPSFSLSPSLKCYVDYEIYIFRTLIPLYDADTGMLFLTGKVNCHFILQNIILHMYVESKI